MPLGLDLRGGLYLLYQVDVNGAISQLLDSYEQDFRRALSAKNIIFSDVVPLTRDDGVANGLRVLVPAGHRSRRRARRDAGRCRRPRPSTAAAGSSRRA